jgi:Uma2 family endonuclease
MIARPEQFQDTFADLHRAIGEVPLERIARTPAPGTATEEDVIAALEAKDRRFYELVDGVLVEKPMGWSESILAGALLRILGNFVDDNDLGVVAGEAGPYRLKLGLVRLPDVSFVPWSLLPEGGTEDLKVCPVIPTLAAEVLSESNTKAEIDRKLREYFEAGVKLVWVIDPRTQTAKVYTSTTKVKEIDIDGALDGGRVVPGFKLPLADLLAKMKRRKKKPR